MFVKPIENGLDLTEIANSIAAVYDTSLEPGQSIPSHYHPAFEEVYYILSGYGIMTIGEEQKEISRGDVVYIPSPAPHSLLNTGSVPLRFVTITVAVSRNRKDDAQPYIC
ncbi:MAG: cupin domain-containing protein [Candidatus Methanoperedens sp.]|nr:cupin domain-containing protein [Candidatus Methanoperedens sp.]